VRSLGRRGVPVTAIAFEDSDPVLYSRHATTKLSVAGKDDDAKEARLLDILQELPLEGAAILTTSDRLVAFMARHHEKLLKKYSFRLPPPKILEALNDKRLETALVQRLGFVIPATVRVLPDEPTQLAEQLRFPIIFKPHVYYAQKLFPPKNAIVRAPDELEDFYREWRQALPVLLAQEVIPGPDGYSWICSTTYDENHTMLACGIKQKLRALPAHFGGSTFAVSRENPDIRELARSLGLMLDYIGHAGIEFRWDSRDNVYKYIELNPRMPANVGFDEASGMPTVWNSYRVALSGTVEDGRACLKENIHYLDVEGDLFSLLEDRTPKLKALATLLGLLLFRRTNGPYFAWDDPLPGLVVAWRLLLRISGSIRRKALTRFWTHPQKA
jgi:predicted ATP-grasp superfamily ATP-dependent carboligase